VVTKESDYGVAGEMEQTCTLCGETVTQETAPLSITEKVSEVITLMVNEYSTAVYSVAGIILLLIFIRIVFKKKK
jgi:hypothetical protein